MLQFYSAPFNLGEENIKAIKSSVLLLMGDNGGVDKNILGDTYKLLDGGIFGDIVGVPKSQLAILPGKKHVSLVMDTLAILATISALLK